MKRTFRAVNGIEEYRKRYLNDLNGECIIYIDDYNEMFKRLIKKPRRGVQATIMHPSNVYSHAYVIPLGKEGTAATKIITQPYWQDSIDESIRMLLELRTPPAIKPTATKKPNNNGKERTTVEFLTCICIKIENKINNKQLRASSLRIVC